MADCGKSFAARIAGLALLATVTLAGCHTTSSASPAPALTAPSSTGAASASPSLSIPGTHKATTVYQISSSVHAITATTDVGAVVIGPAA